MFLLQEPLETILGSFLNIALITLEEFEHHADTFRFDLHNVVVKFIFQKRAVARHHISLVFDWVVVWFEEFNLAWLYELVDLWVAEQVAN